MRRALALLSALLVASSATAFAQKGGHSGSHAKARATTGSHATATPRAAVGSHAARSSSATPRSEVHVRTYTKKSGTVVQSHARSAPNATKRDNWTTKGNVNPHTGRVGTKDPTVTNKP